MINRTFSTIRHSINVTNVAWNKMIQISEKQNKFHFLFSATSGGCNGYNYKLKLIDISNNLGDSKTLITHPCTTTHHRLSNTEKKQLGINENMVRLSVGLEEVNDIIEDINSSIKKTFTK